MSRTVPLCMCFVATVLAFTGAFTASLWLTLNGAAVSSVGDLSVVFQTTVMYNLKNRLGNVLVGMVHLLDGWEAIPEMRYSTSQEVMSYTYNLMSKNPVLQGMYFAQPNGETAGAIRMPSGGVAVGHRPPCAVGVEANMTFWSFNGSLGSVYLTTMTDPRLLPWYRTATAQGGPAFTYTAPSALTTAHMITATSVVFYPNNTLAAAYGVAYPFSALSDQLTAAHLELRSSGMLFLIEKDTKAPIASATASPATLDRDILQIQHLAGTAADFQDGDIQHHHFDTFGDAVVLQMQISSSQASGLRWTLVVVLPDSDYYTHIWQQNKVAGAEAATILVGFLATLVVMLHIFLTRPLRMLTRHIDQLRYTLVNGGASSSSSISIEFSVVASPEEHIAHRSRFTELRALYASVVAAVAAAGEVSHQRAVEAAQTAELRRAEEQTQALMRAKE
eukprot:RCo052537